MIQLSRILCAVDFSTPSQKAFARAVALSREHNAVLTVVHAVPLTESFAQNARQRTRRIETLRETAKAEGIELRVSVQQGDAAGVIVLHANAEPFDLVVLGTHQRAGISRLRQGSVAVRVVQRVTSPVLIVPRLANDTDEATALPFGRIVCATDFEPASNAALSTALPIATKTAGNLTVVHVVNGVSSETSRHARPVPEYFRLRAADAWRRLQAAIPLQVRDSARVHAKVVAGTPAHEIVRVANEAQADMIVMGTTSRGWMGRRLFGSTVAGVMRRAGCPVLAVPAPKSNQRSAPQVNSTTKVAA